MKFLKFSCLLFSTLVLASCATAPLQPPLNSTQTTTTSTTTRTAASVNAWDINGKVALRNNTGKGNDLTANIKWEQRARQYSILLFGPLGAGALKLSGHPGQVKLQTADGKTYNAHSPEQLLADQAHIYMPVSSLYYWIRGVPVPGIPSTPSYDAAHRLTNLQQQGWKIQFLNYTSVNNIAVPDKIFLFNPQLNVKIVINEWKI